MKFKRFISLIFVFFLLLFGCSEANTIPTNLTTSSNEVKLIIGSERDLNDIVTLRYEPNNTLSRDVTWSCEENEVFTLNGSLISANRVGSAVVTATSVANTNLSTDVTVTVYNLDLNVHYVSINEHGDFEIIGLSSIYEVGETVEFKVNLTTTGKKIVSVKANDDTLEQVNGTYSFSMPDEDIVINVELLTLVTATSVTLDKTTLEITSGNVAEIVSATVEPANTTDEAVWSIVEGENIIAIEPNGNSVSIIGLENGNAKVKVSYNENVYGECNIVVNKPDFVTSYNIEYDMGSKTQSVKLNSADAILNTFKTTTGGESIISSVSEFNYIYGGGYGSGTNAWSKGNMLKFGTQSAMGYLVLNLNTKVIGVKITGYVNFTTCEVRIGDSASGDWTEAEDNKTAKYTCSDMSVVSKDVVEANQTSSFTVNFEATNSLRIGTLKKGPLYITAIEFICE